jgi:hypothetical protein
MRYAQGGGLTAEGRRRRELVRLAAVEKFEQRVPVAEIAAELRKETWPRVKDPRRSSAPGIVFEDETGQSLRPPRSRTWGEGIWSSLKRGPLANLAFTGPGHLLKVIRHGLRKIQYQPGLIEGCLAGTGISLEPDGPTS